MSQLEKNPKRKLKPKQQKFVREFLVDRNATQAAIRAGYSVKTARSTGAENMTKPDIKRAIDEAEAKDAEETKLTRQYVIDGLMANAERAMQYREVLDKDGKPTGEFKYEGQVANGAYRLLGQHLGMFEEKVKVETEKPLIVVRVMRDKQD